MAGGGWEAGGALTCKIANGSGEPFFHEKFRLRGGPIRANAVFDGHNAGLVFAKGRINGSQIRHHMTMDNGQIFLLDGAGLPDFAQFTGGFGIFSNEDEAGGLAIEPVNQIRRGGRMRNGGWRGVKQTLTLQIDTGTADEAGILIALRRMTDEIGRFVDDEQVGVFVDDGEQFFQTLKIKPCGQGWTQIFVLIPGVIS